MMLVKLGYRDDILLKLGKLTVEELEIIKQHPMIGAEIIGEHDAEVLNMAHVIALSHHEKWNGAGYPAGLIGAQIPLVARIVAIADVFDALTCIRPYKAAWSVGKALALIAEEAGQHFDPDLVALFLGVEVEVRRIATEYGETMAGAIETSEEEE